jgi:hypothetical protein
MVLQAPRCVPLVLRLVRAFALAGIALLLLYLAAINVFLSTSLFGTVVNAKPDVIDIHFDRAWSLIPGIVHARHISIRGQDGDIEWLLRIDDVRFRVSFVWLAKQRFAARDVRGKGLSFRLRHRLATAPSSPADVADLPPIEGLPPYTLRPRQTPSRGDWNDEYYDLWSAHLEDVVADDTREVWIDHARFEGSAHIEGRFFFRPVREVEVGPARVALEHGAVSTGRGPVVEGLDGSKFDVTITRFDPRITGGSDALAHVTLNSDLHGTLPEIARLAAWPASLKAEGAAQVRRAVLRVSSGVLEAGSHFDVAFASLAVAGPGLRATGELGLTADVAREDGGPKSRLTFHAEAMNLLAFQLQPRAPPSKPFLRVPRVDATGNSAALALARPFDDLHAVVDLAESDLPDARALSRYVPAGTPVGIAGGRAQTSGRLEIWLAEKRAAASASLRARDLDLRVGELRLRGRTSVRAWFGSFHFGTHSLEDARVEVTGTDGSLASARAPDTPLVHVGTLRLDARAPQVDLRNPLARLSVTIAMPTADVVSLGLLHAYLPKGSAMPVVAGHGRFSLDGKLTLAGAVARGTLDIAAKRLLFAYRDLELAAGVRVSASVHDWHWVKGDLALDQARVDVERPTIRRGSASVGRAQTAASIAHVSVRASSPRFVFADPLAKLSVAATLAGGRVGDPAGLGVLLPEKTALWLDSDNGGFDADLRVDVERHIARGQVHARAFRMGAGGGALRIRGNVDLFADVTDWDLDRGRLSLTDSRVTIRQVEGRLRPGREGDLSPDDRSRSEQAADFSARRVALEVRSPGFDLENPALRGGDFHLVMEDAVLPRAPALDALLSPDSPVSIESGSARASADLTVSASERAARGAVDVSLSNGVVRVEGTRFSGDFRLRAGLQGYRPEEDLLGLSDARLEMRNVAVTGATASTAGWQGVATFSRASLRLKPAPELDGVVGLDARDARPLLAILFGGDFPGILVRVTDVPRLVGVAQVSVGPDRLALLDLSAGGGNVGLRGSYAAVGARRRGGVIARKWFLSVGLGLDDNNTWLRLFGLDGWLRRQRAAAVELLGAPPAR